MLLSHHHPGAAEAAGRPAAAAAAAAVVIAATAVVSVAVLVAIAGLVLAAEVPSSLPQVEHDFLEFGGSLRHGLGHHQLEVIPE